MSARDRVRRAVDAAGEPFERRPQRPLPAAVRDVRALGGPAQDAVVAAPRGPVADPDLGVWVAVRLGGRRLEPDDVERAAGPGLGRDEALEEQVAERLVVAVQLAVGRDDQRRVAAVPDGAVEPWRDALAGEPVGIGGGGGFERDGGGQLPVVEHRRDVAAAADVDAVRLAGIEVGGVGLPRREDHGLDAGLRRDPQRRKVDRGLREPHRGRRAAEPPREVAQPPQDLGPLVGVRRERQDRVVERLGHARCRPRPGRARRSAQGPRAPRGRGTRSASRRGSTRCGPGCRAPRSAGSTPR